MSSRRPFFRAVSQEILNVLHLPGRQHGSYERVKSEEISTDSHVVKTHSLTATLWRFLQQCSRRFLLSIATVVSLAFLLGTLLSTSRHSQVSTQSVQDHLLFLMVPSSHADSELCKTVLTAAVLGYPTPYLINWDLEYDRAEKNPDRQREKVRMTSDYLSRLGRDHDEDIVILLDGPDTWFQLRPETLLSRYYAINERANRRLRRSLGPRAMAENNISQSVVFSVQNHCSGHTLDQVACYAVPEPPLSGDVDRNLRYLNVGTTIGPVKDLREIFRRVSGKAGNIKSSGVVEAQTILEEIYGEQEFQREIVRQRYWSVTKRIWSGLVRKLGYGQTITDPTPGRQLMGSRANERYEFGIGIDYGSNLGLSLDHQEADAEFIQHSSASRSAGFSTPLPRDIATSMPPFWTTSGQELPSGKLWEDVQLLSDKRTKSIPALINFKWGTEDVSPLQRSGWKKLWMHSHVRQLFEAQQEVPRLPIASAVDGNATDHIFWNRELRMDRDGANTVGGVWVPWNDICDWDSM